MRYERCDEHGEVVEVVVCTEPTRESRRLEASDLWTRAEPDGEPDQPARAPVERPGRDDQTFDQPTAFWRQPDPIETFDEPAPQPPRRRRQAPKE